MKSLHSIGTKKIYKKSHCCYCKMHIKLFEGYTIHIKNRYLQQAYHMSKKISPFDNPAYLG